jgi:hypothetical protein
MSEDGMIVLEGLCPSEDAETLLQRLLAGRAATVDLRDCIGLHTAVIQVLLAAKASVRLPAADDEYGARYRALLGSVITY